MINGPRSSKVETSRADIANDIVADEESLTRSGMDECIEAEELWEKISVSTCVGATESS